MRRRHLPVPEEGQRLGNVVRGYLACYADAVLGPGMGPRG